MERGGGNWQEAVSFRREWRRREVDEGVGEGKKELGRGRDE